MKILYKIKCEYLLFATMVFALSKASKRVLNGVMIDLRRDKR